MTSYFREALVVLLLGGVSVVLHVFFRNNLFSYVPVLLLLPIGIVWLAYSPGYLLLILAMLAELFSALPFGLTTLIIICPLLLYRVRGKIEVDLSFSFAAIIGGTVVLQSSLLTAPHLAEFLGSAAAWPDVYRWLPWRPLVVTVVSTTLSSFIICLLFRPLLKVERSRIRGTRNLKR